MPGAYTDQLLTELVSQDGTVVAKVGGALGGGLNFTAPLTATPNGSTGNVDIGLNPSTSQSTFIPSLIGIVVPSGVDGSHDFPVTPLWVNRTGASVTFAGADLWPSQNVTADGTNYETVALLVYTTTTLTGSPASSATITTASVSWVAHTPLAISGGGLTIPSGGTLAINAGHSGTGATLGSFVIRMR